MRDLKQLEKKYEELGKEIEALKNKPEGIDWSKMPKDTLVEVRDSDRGNWVKKWFSYYDKGSFECFVDGGNSKTTTSTLPWYQIRLIENDPKPWFGGDCPIPGGVKVRIWWRIRDLEPLITSEANIFDWSNTLINGEGEDIIAYQILGEEK